MRIFTFTTTALAKRLVSFRSFTRSAQFTPLISKSSSLLLKRPETSSCLIQFRQYSSAQVTISETEERVLKVLKSFDKVDTAKLTIQTPFTNLGLDSLDVVEVMIALEEEFHMEIPDVVADKVQTPKEVAEYIYGFLNPHKAEAKDDYSEDSSH